MIDRLKITNAIFSDLTQTPCKLEEIKKQSII